MRYNGLNKTTGLANMQDGDSPFAQNMIYAKDNNTEGISNESGMSLVYTHTKKIIGIITTNEKIDIIFSGQVDTVDIPEIGKFQNGVYTTIIKDNILGFKNPIKGQYYFNNLGELIIQWWDGVYSDSNTPKVLNIDCLPFKLNIDFSLVNASDIELISIAPKRTIPLYEVKKVNNTGGKLKTGAYFFTIAPQYSDSTVGDFVQPSLPIYINKDASEVYNNFNGEDADTLTSKSITIKITQISSYIRKVTLGVIKKIGGVYSAITIPDIPIINGELIYTYTGYKEIDSSLEELLISRVNIIKAQAGTQIDNKSYLGNVVHPEVPNIQPYVNGIQLKWIYDDVRKLSEKINSSKDMVFLYKNKGYKSNEVYDFYLIGHLPTGESQAFHIPGKSMNTISFTDEQGNIFTCDENDLISDIISQHPTSISMLEALEVNAEARVHEIFNTAASNGSMGYWENQDEIYPDVDCSDIKDSTNTVIGTNRNFKVRHHKFPSFSQLKNWESTVIAGNKLTNLVFLKLNISDGILPGISMSVTADNTSSDFGILDPTDVNNTTFIFQKECNIRIKFYFLATGLAGIDKGIIQLTQTGSNTSILHRWEYPTGPNDVEYTTYVNVRAKAGDKIKLETFNLSGGTINALSYLEFQDWSFERYDAEAKILGVELSNISIPVDIRQKFIKFELGYAERTSENSTILASTPAQGADKLRMHCLDAFTFRSTLDYDYIESHVAYLMEEGVANLDSETIDWGIRKAQDAQYVPAYSNTIEDNSLGEEYIYTKVSPALPAVGSLDMSFVQRYIDLKRYKNSVYAPREFQNIIPTNFYLEPTDTFSGNIYGGDINLNLIGWYKNLLLTEATEPEFWIVPLREELSNKRYDVIAHVYPLETIVNSGYMSQNEDARYALSYPDMVKPALYSFDNNGTLNPPVIEKVVQFSQNDNKWEYNSDYHSLLNFLSIPVFNCTEECNSEILSKFPYRIYRSEGFNKDSNNLNWKFYKANDYYELPKNKGVIWILERMNRTLLINTLYSFFVAGPKDHLATDTLDAYLASGDIFDRPPEEQLTIEQGYGGCQSAFAAFLTPIGYIFVDLIQGKVFVFDGRLKELTDLKTRNFFREEFKLNYPEGIDNPFTTSGLVGGWDEKNNRIIIAKRVRDFLGLNNFTLSYSVLNNNWISYHTYRPSYMFFNRHGLYTLDNQTVGKIYSNNTDVVGKFFDGAIAPSYVDIAIQINLSNKSWNDILWSSYSENVNQPQVLETFTHIMIYNDHQCTDLKPINNFLKLQFKDINSRNKLQNWYFNKLIDLVVNPNSFILDKFGEIVNSNISKNKAGFKRNRFTSRTIVVRLYNDNISTNSVTLTDLSANFIEIER